MIMRRIASLLLPFALAVLSPAFAAEAPKEVASDRQMIAPNVITPVVRDGKLVNYLFVTVEVDFTDQANAIKLRDRAHFLRDALLKASHRAPLADPAHDDQLNRAAAEAAFRVAANESLGPENIKSVTVTGVDSLRRR
jgi:hypothetical protein